MAEHVAERLNRPLKKNCVEVSDTA
eukprot:COSAG04_NODE_28615_length_274_cov_1.022857_1_plen_24_part_10